MNERLILMTKRLFLSCVMLSTAHAQWKQLTSLPEPNGGFVCGVVDGKIIVAGGTNWEGGKKNWLRTVNEFDPQTLKWVMTADLIHPVAYAVGFHYAGAFSYIGGSDGVSPIKEFSVPGGKETVSLPELPSSIVLSSGGVLGRFIIVGGTDNAANLADVQRSTYGVSGWKGKWSVDRLADYPGKPFATAASAVAGEELFVFGGMNYDAEAKLPLNTAEAYAFSLERNAWRKLKPLATPTRGLSAVRLDDQHIYIAGGYRDDFTADAVIYDVTTDGYTLAKPLPYAAMVSLVKHDGFVYCLGGEDKKQSRTDKFFRIPVAELLK